MATAMEIIVARLIVIVVAMALVGTRVIVVVARVVPRPAASIAVPISAMAIAAPVIAVVGPVVASMAAVAETEVNALGFRGGRAHGGDSEAHHGGQRKCFEKSHCPIPGSLIFGPPRLRWLTAIVRGINYRVSGGTKCKWRAITENRVIFEKSTHSVSILLEVYSI